MSTLGGMVIGWTLSNVAWWALGTWARRKVDALQRERLEDAEYRLDRANRRAQQAEAALRDAVCRTCYHHRQSGTDEFQGRH